MVRRIKETATNRFGHEGKLGDFRASLNESYLHSQPFPENYPQIVEVFLAHLPADLVPYWDFDFNDQHPAEKDSSALAIAACGLLEAEKMGAYPDAKNR